MNEEVSGKKLLGSLSLPQISEAALAEIRERGHASVDWQLNSGVAHRLGSDMQSTGAQDRWDVPKIQGLFSDRVERALKKHAEAGTIRRSGSKEPGPDGRTERYVTYWTPEAWAAAAERERKRREAADTEKRRWRDIEARLARGTGLTLDERNRRLTTAEWEWLLDQAGWQ